MGWLAIPWCLVSVTGCAQILGIDDRIIDAAPACGTMYVDSDGDGHGSPYAPTTVCDAPPAGVVASNDDCSSFDPTTYTGAPEICDGADNDCDTEVDENACPSGCSAARRPPPDYDRIYLFCAAATVSQAEQNCMSAGGHLTPIQSQAENDFVAFTAAMRLGTAQVLIGGTDATTEGVWRWIESSTQFTMGATCTAGQFCNWEAGQPNNGNGGNEDCLELVPPTWNDVNCNTSNPYVCRI